MPPSTRANVPVVDDEAAESSAEQHASRPLLNIDMAVNAAVERQFEQHSAEMIERMLAALDSRGARSTQPVSGSPAAANGTDATNCNQMQSVQSTSSDGAVGTFDANQDSGHSENFLSNAGRRSPQC